MKLTDILNRKRPPIPWDEGEKIPWNDPEFSERMLREHLSQAHDAASRRFEIIDRHVSWIHQHILQGKPTPILDLGCGPGLYASRLARLGHACTGIDFSPASIEYARETARAEGLEIRYTLDDIRTADYGDGFGLVMLIFGEFNVFKPSEARAILEKAFHALAHGGLLLLEPHAFGLVEALGKKPPFWYSAEKGLFSDAPHLFLEEHHWDGDHNAAVYRYYVIDAETGRVSGGSSSTQAYTDEEYRSMLAASGFGDLQFFPTLGVSEDGAQGDLFAILARKPSD